MSELLEHADSKTFKIKKSQSFRTKIIAISFISILIGLILNAASSVFGIRSLSEEATIEISKGLKNANIEYLNNYIDLTSQRISFTINSALGNGFILNDIMQKVIDNKDLADLQYDLDDNPYFSNEFSYTPKFTSKKTHKPAGNWSQSNLDKDTVISVWGYLLNDDHKIRADVLEDIKRTSILDLFMPSLFKQGQWLYYVGAKERSYLRITPSINMAAEFDASYPGHNELNFWDFFFPTLVESWEKIPDSEKKTPRVTVTPPYEDAAGSGFITSFFYPLWDKGKFAGAIGLDFNLKHIIKYVQDVKLAQTGFAFIANQSGTILAVNEHGSKVMGLKQSEEKKKGVAVPGVSELDRNLANSRVATFANLKFPIGDEISYIETDNLNGEGYVIVLKRMLPLNYYHENGITKEYMNLGFVVPKNEIYAALSATQNKIQDSKNKILLSSIIISLATLLFVFVAIFKFSGNMTRGLKALVEGAQKIQKKEYDVEVKKLSNDEIGQLAGTFNSMSKEILLYTQKLEGLVHERTKELEGANKEIGKLNAILKTENTRLSSELDVAQTIQKMVLPKNEELKLMAKFDISAYMKPADEVGGDYYDVLTNEEGNTKIGIGDVTGHGLESGVIMLMVQTAVRSLLFSGITDPTKFYSIINQVIYSNIQRIGADKFITLSLLDLNSTGEVKITGQHEDVIIIRENGDISFIDTMDLGLPVGIMDDISDAVHDFKVQLNNGDVLLLHTDGITEAENEDREQFGIQRLSELVCSVRSLSADEIRNTIIKTLYDYMGEVKPDDDVTMVVIKGCDKK